MTNILRHPLAGSLTTLLVGGAVTYFGFISDMDDKGVKLETRQDILVRELEVIKLRLENDEVRIADIEKKKETFVSLTSRVAQLEAQYQSISITQATQIAKLDYLQQDITEMKEMMKNKKKADAS